MGSGLRKGTGATSSHPFFCIHIEYGQFWFGVREGPMGAYCWLLWLVPVGAWATFLWFPLDWFKVLAHSQAMWPQPWHLKHWRELGSFLFEVPPWLSLDPWAFCPWPPVGVIPVPQPTEVLQAEVVCPRPVWPLWDFGRPGVFLSIHHLP